MRCRRRTLYPLLLVLVMLVPYARLVTMRGVVVTDDVFASDLMNGELPLREAVGKLVRDAESPAWSPDLCGGYPLLAAGGADPLTLLLFGLFPKTIALNLLILGLLVLCGLGAYAYARRIGSSPTGAWLSGFAFAYSGFVVCHFKHLALLTTVAWFPWALYFLERALGGGAGAQGAADVAPTREPVSGRVVSLCGFGLVLGLQILAGFPQAVYISALVYLAYAAAYVPALLFRRCPWRHLVWLFCALGAAVLLGVAVGAIQLVPQWELSQLSQRAGRLNVAQAAHVAFWPRDLWMFLSPYINGDISNLSYKGWGRSVFWEDYGYVGVVPLGLAAYAIYGAVVRGQRRWQVITWSLLLSLALLMVVSLATPVFGLAHRFLPGMNVFRFPTRFMFVVDFALAVMAGMGLTRVEEVGTTLARRGWRLPTNLSWLSWLILALTVLDLTVHQLRQNPVFDAERWFSPPITAQLIQQDGVGPLRIFSVGAMESHIQAFEKAKGWSGDLSPYVAQRDFLQANSHLFWGLAAPNCYMGLVSRWNREFWGPSGTITRADLRGKAAVGGGLTFTRLLALWNVRYVLTPWPVNLPGTLRLVGRSPRVLVYELRDALPRTFMVPTAEFHRTRAEGESRLFAPSFDPRKQVLLEEEARRHVSSTDSTTAGSFTGSARIEEYRGSQVTIRASSTAGGFLVLADAWYPGWVAEIDGKSPAVLLNANLGQRAVALPPGAHVVRFAYRSSAVRYGFWASLLGLAGLAVGAGVGHRVTRRRRDHRSGTATTGHELPGSSDPTARLS